jgi:glutamate synthase (NADPH/NADH) large chain
MNACFRTIGALMEKPLREPSNLIPAERDACAIISYINKAGHPTHGNVQRTIEAFIKMGHRAGEISGQGDGCGVLTDIPRQLWRDILAGSRHAPDMAEEPGFALGHLLIPRDSLAADPELQEKILQRFRDASARILENRPGPVRIEVLSSMARHAEPLFWQVALHLPDPGKAVLLLYDFQITLELDFPVHVASLSTQVVSYKIYGAPEILPRYYPELKHRNFLSSVTIGHSRFSTNTLPTVMRAQPFSILGHNGEINTIARLREKAGMMGIALPPGGK